jgi:hypothetical protein
MSLIDYDKTYLMPNLIKDKLSCQTFKRAGKHYISKAGIISIHKRKDCNRLKPELYAFYEPLGEAKIYLSSLYPQPDGSFIAEKNRQFWKVTLTDQEIAFSPVIRRNQKSAYEYQ